VQHNAESPEGPTLPARPSGGYSRAGRLALGVLLSTVVTAIVLAAPVVTGQGTPHSPVVIGQDGVPTSATFAGVTSAATFSSETGEVSAAPGAGEPAAADTRTAEPSAEAPAGAPDPDPAPVTAAGPVVPAPVVPEPTPAPAPVAAPEPAPAPGVEPGPEPAAPVAAAAAPVATGTEGEVLALVNEQRTAAGCGPLTVDGELAAVARAHSEDMRDRDFFDHVNPAGLDPFERADRAGVAARAENIARGQADAATAMNSWMGSAGHRANILDCSLTRLGVGRADGGGGPWWTQLFG
jgi:uncharacterized protein YkwD